MTIGKLDRLGQLQKSSLTKGTGGENTQRWEDVEQLWCSRPEMKKGVLPVTANQETSVVNYIFFCRYRPTVKPYMRLMIEGVIHDILVVSSVGTRREQLEIHSSVTGQVC